MASSACDDSVQLRKATICDSSIGLLPTSATHGGGQNSLYRATTTSTLNSTPRNSLTRSSKRRSLKVVKRAFVRNTNCFWLFKSKSHVEAQYAYGTSEESYQSSPETTRMKPHPLVLTERYNQSINQSIFIYIRQPKPIVANPIHARHTFRLAFFWPHNVVKCGVCCDNVCLSVQPSVCLSIMSICLSVRFVSHA